MIYLFSLSIIFVMLLPMIVLGRQIALLLPETSHQNLGFFLAPLFGLAVLTMAATAYGWFFPFKTIVSVPFLCILSLLGIWREQNRTELLKVWFLTFVVSTVLTLPILASAARFDGFNPFNDAFTYLVHAQWLQQYPFSKKPLSSGFFPALSQITLYQIRGHRMGASFFFGFVQSVFHLQWSYYAFLGVVSLVFTTGCLAIGAIIRQVIPVSMTVALGLCSLPAFTMNGFNFGAQGGFFPQTFGLAFAAGIGCLIPASVAYIIDVGPSLREMLPRVIPLTIVFVAFMLTYNDMIAVYGPAIVIYVLFLLLIYPESRKRIIAGVLCVSMLALLMLNLEGIRIFRNFVETVLTAGAGVISFGWPVLWSPLDFAAYGYGLKFLSYLFIVIFLCILLICLHTWRKRRDEYTIPLLFCINLTIAAAFIKLRYFSPSLDGEVGITFLQFKVAKWLSPFGLAMLGIALAYLYTRAARFASMFKVVFVIFCVVGLRQYVFLVAPADTRYFLNETQRSYSPFNLFTDLRERLASVPRDEVVYLGIPHSHHKLTQMIAYTLSDRKIAGKYQDGYIEPYLPIDERDIPINKASWLVEYKPFAVSGENPSHRVGPFYIHQAPFTTFSLEDMVGGYATEGNDKAVWNWVEDTVSFTFRNLGDLKSAQLRFSHRAVGEPRMLFIKVVTSSGEEQQFVESTLPDSMVAYIGERLSVAAEPITVTISSSGIANVLSSKDARKAKFMIQNITLTGAE